LENHGYTGFERRRERIDLSGTTQRTGQTVAWLMNGLSVSSFRVAAHGPVLENHGDLRISTIAGRKWKFRCVGISVTLNFVNVTEIQDIRAKHLPDLCFKFGMDECTERFGTFAIKSDW
jgi:hypothetical protein